MKGIIVLDEIPKNCRSCYLMMTFGLRYVCAKYRNIIPSDIVRGGEKPDWCPIKIPKKIPGEIRYQNEYEKGWNSCIDEILKE